MPGEKVTGETMLSSLGTVFKDVVGDMWEFVRTTVFRRPAGREGYSQVPIEMNESV